MSTTVRSQLESESPISVNRMTVDISITDETLPLDVVFPHLVRFLLACGFTQEGINYFVLDWASKIEKKTKK